MQEHNPYQSPESSTLEDTDEACSKMYFFSTGQRIGRLRYFAYTMGIYVLFSVIVGGLALVGMLVGAGDVVGSAVAVFGFLGVFLYIGLLVFIVILGVRRLHDLDKTGWFCLLFLVPFVNLVMAIYVCFFPGTNGTNRFGPKPMPNNMGTWVAGLALPMITLIGMLAAIALPAYQEYVARAQQAQISELLYSTARFLIG